jgi:hypothetical protein
MHNLKVHKHFILLDYDGDDDDRDDEDAADATTMSMQMRVERVEPIACAAPSRLQRMTLALILTTGEAKTVDFEPLFRADSDRRPE